MASKLKQRKKNEKLVKQTEVDSNYDGVCSENETGSRNDVSNSAKHISDIQECNNSSEHVENNVKESQNEGSKSLLKKKTHRLNNSGSLNRSSETILPSAFFNKEIKPPSFHFEVDVVALVMLAVALCTRMWHLEDPKGIV